MGGLEGDFVLEGVRLRNEGGVAADDGPALGERWYGMRQLQSKKPDKYDETEQEMM